MTAAPALEINPPNIKHRQAAIGETLVVLVDIYDDNV